MMIASTRSWISSGSVVALCASRAVVHFSSDSSRPCSPSIPWLTMAPGWQSSQPKRDRGVIVRFYSRKSQLDAILHHEHDRAGEQPATRPNNSATHDLNSSRLLTTPEMVLDYIAEYRAKVVDGDRGYLDVRPLWVHLRQRSPLTVLRSPSVNRTWNTMMRMMRGVDACVEVGLASSVVITAYDIEKQILALSFFKDCQTFADIGVGPLLLHPRIKRAMGPGSPIAQVGDAAMAKKYGLDLSRADEMYSALATNSKVPEHTYMDFIQWLSRVMVSEDVKTFTLDEYLCQYAKMMSVSHPVELCMSYRSEKLTKLLIDRGRKKKERAIRVSNRMLQNQYDALFKEKMDAEAERRFEELETIIEDLRELTSSVAREERGRALGLVQRHLLALLHDPKSRFIATREGLDGLIRSLLAPLVVWCLDGSSRFDETTSRRELTGLLSSTSKELLSVLEKLPQATETSTKGRAESAPACEEREAEMLDHVRGVLLLGASADGANDVLAVLAAAEKAIVEHKDLTSFEALGLGSFCAFCARNWDKLGPLVQPSHSRASDGMSAVEGGAAVSEASELARELARACARTEEDAQGRVDDMLDMLRLQLSCAGASLLSPEAMAEVVAEALVEAEAGGRRAAEAQGVVALASLAFPPPEYRAFRSKAERLEGLDPVHAVTQCPRLRDVGAALSWGLVFEPSHGSLAQFLADKAAVLAARQIQVLRVGGGSFWVVDSNLTVDAFKLALREGDGRRCATVLVSLCVQEPQQSTLPLALLAEQAGERMREGDASALVLEAIAAMPLALAPITNRVLLQPFLRAHEHAAERLLAPGRALVHEEVVALHNLGLVLGVDAWTESLHEAYVRGFPRTSLQVGKMLSAGHGSADKEHAMGQASLLRDSTASSEQLDTRAAVDSRMESAASQSADSRQSSTPTLAAMLEADQDDAVAYNARICGEIRRRLGFDLDQSLNAEERSILEDLRAVTQRSIKRLGADLYSKDIHFMFELIQNADDNAYHDRVVPSLDIACTQDAIRFQNNEVGFSLSNVLALCSIDKSTKMIARRDNIGHKGIGFKSVFKITRRPEIHSGKFHFAFDSSDGGLGYIVPHPVTAPDRWDEGSGTTIVLPFEESRSTNVRKAINDIRPTLLLFLRKLRVMTLLDHTRGESRTMRRMSLQLPSLGSELVSILVFNHAQLASTAAPETEIADPAPFSRFEQWSAAEWKAKGWEMAGQYALTEIVVNIPIASSRSQAEAETTTMKLALPIHSEEDLSRPLPLQDTFAFLPLRSYGFRVVLHADWDVPSSRESIESSSARNQLLRDHIPELFRACVRDVVAIASRGHASADEESQGEPGALHEHGVHVLNNLLCVLPLPGQLSEFFAPSAAAVTQELKREKFFPCSDGRFSLPSQCVIRIEDAELMDRTEPYLQRLGFAWAAPGLSVPRGVAEALGVRLFDASLILELLQSLAASHWHSADHVDLEWLVRVLASLNGDRHLHKFLLHYQQIAFVPLANGSLAKFEDGPLFELEDAEALLQFSFAARQRVLSPELSRALRSSPSANTILSRMGMKRTHAVEFFAQHNSAMLSHHSTSASELVGLLQFAKMHLMGPEHSAFWSKMRGEGVLLLTREGGVAKSGEETILLGPDYDDMLQPLYSLKGVSGALEVLGEWQRSQVVSSSYLAADQDREGWVRLFKQLGVVELIRITPWTGPVAESPDHRYWTQEINAHIQREGRAHRAVVDAIGKSAILRDFHSEELHSLIRALCKSQRESAEVLDAKHAILPALFRAIVHGWESDFKDLAWAEIDVNGRKYRSYASWMSMLRRSRWLRSTDGVWCQPDELFIATREIKRLFGSSVPYFDEDCPASLAEALNITAELKPTVVFTKMQEWQKSSSFSTPLRPMMDVYKYIDDHLPEWKALQAAHAASSKGNTRGVDLADGAEIHLFVPKDYKQVSASWHRSIPGYFVPLSQCVLSDPVGMLDPINANVFPIHKKFATKDGRPIIPVVGRMYRQLERTLQRLGCAAYPRPANYLDIMEEVTKHEAKVIASSMLVALRLLAWLGRPEAGLRAMPAADVEVGEEEEGAEFDGQQQDDLGEATADSKGGSESGLSDILQGSDLAEPSRAEQLTRQAELSRYRDQLEKLLMDKQVLPSSAGTWISLKQVWFYHDREEVYLSRTTRLPMEVREHLFATEHEDPKWNLSFSVDKYNDLKSLLNLLGIPPISECFQFSGETVGEVVEWPGAALEEVCAAAHAIQAWGTRAAQMGEISEEQLDSVRLKLRRLTVIGADSIKLVRRLLRGRQELWSEDMGFAKMCLNLEDLQLLVKQTAGAKEAEALRSIYADVAAEMLKIVAPRWQCTKADQTALRSLMEATMQAYIGAAGPDPQLTSPPAASVERVLAARHQRAERWARAERAMQDEGLEALEGIEHLWLPYPELRNSVSDLNAAVRVGRVAKEPKGRHKLFNMIQAEMLREQRGSSTSAGPSFDLQAARAAKMQRGVVPGNQIEKLLEHERKSPEAIGSPEYREQSAPLSSGFALPLVGDELEPAQLEVVHLDQATLAEEPPGAAGLGKPQDRTAMRGEWIVFQHLRKEQEAAGRKVVWVNQDGERGEPFDLMVLDEHESVLSFVEVKTTTHTEKRTFEVSRRELDFAMQMGSKYILFRVALDHTASQSPVVLTKVEHLARHLGKSVHIMIYLGRSQPTEPALALDLNDGNSPQSPVEP